MPKFNDRFTGLFRGTNSPEIISEAEQIIAPPSSLEMFDEELNRNAPATPVNQRRAWHDWEELKFRAAEATGGLEGRSMDVVEAGDPEGAAAARRNQFIEWDNDLARQEFNWRNHPVLKDLPENPNYFKLKDDWAYRGQIAPDSLALLENEIRIHKQPQNIPRSFGSNDKKYWEDLVEQWGNSRRQSIAATMDQNDPRVYMINRDAKRSEQNMKNFIETMDNPPPAASATPKPKSQARYTNLPSLDDIKKTADEATQLLDSLPGSNTPVTETPEQLLKSLGGDSSYEGPHIFYKDQTPSQQAASLLEEMNQLDRAEKARALTQSASKPKVKPTGQAVRPKLRAPKGLEIPGTGLMLDVGIGGALSYATGETDDPMEAAWAGVTGLIPESTNTAMGTMPMTIGGKQYHRTSEPSRVIGPGGKYYGLEYLNGKPQIVPYGRGAAGLAPIYQPVVDTVDAINTTSTRRKAEARKQNETRTQRAKQRFAQPGRINVGSVNITDFGLTEWLGIN